MKKQSGKHYALQQYPELKQRFQTHNRENHERQFHGAWIPSGVCQRRVRVQGGKQLICSKRWIYLPDKLHWKCEKPAGGVTSAMFASASGSKV